MHTRCSGCGEPAVAIDSSRWRKPGRLPVLVGLGLGELFRQRVPEEALQRTGDVVWVVCRCGRRHLLPVARVLFCDESCGRWFLLDESARVWVKVWPREQAA